MDIPPLDSFKHLEKTRRTRRARSEGPELRYRTTANSTDYFDRRKERGLNIRKRRVGLSRFIEA